MIIQSTIQRYVDIQTVIVNKIVIKQVNLMKSLAEMDDLTNVISNLQEIAQILLTRTNMRSVMLEKYPAFIYLFI